MRERLPRIPLPLKLFLSYLLVVSFGAVPTFVYLSARLQQELLTQTTIRLTEEARRLARDLGTRADPAVRLDRVQSLASLVIDRVTYLSPTGEVLFDSTEADPAKLPNHLGRPEVQAALGTPIAPIPAYAASVSGAGVAQRVSETTAEESLYAAVRVSSSTDALLGVVRIATPVRSVDEATTSTMKFARNTQAVAVSLAIGLSVLAAILFVRPLQRVTQVAQRLAAGDFAAAVGRLNDDEVGDAGRALDEMAVSLRRRMAAAGAGEALISQLVDALAVPCVVFEVDGTVVAINGGARRALRVEGPAAGRRMKELVQSAELARALQKAEHDGDPEPVSLHIATGVSARGVVHVLKRPGIAPLHVFLADEQLPKEATTLPPSHAVRARALSDVVDEGMRDANVMLAGAGITLDVPAMLPGVLVADCEGRLGNALSAALRGCVPAFGGRQGTLCVGVTVEDTRVRVALDSIPSGDALAAIRPLVEPLGGGIDVNGGEATLWLPKA